MERTTERHPLDVFSLLAGIVFVGIGTVFLVSESASLDVDLGWIFAGLLVGLGLAAALGTLTRRRPSPAVGLPGADGADGTSDTGGDHGDDGGEERTDAEVSP